MISILLSVLIVAAVGALAWWAVNKLGTPDPLKNWILVFIVVLCALWVLGILTDAGGGTYRLIKLK